MLKDYLTRSREARYSLTFALPLLLLYEASSLAVSGSASAGIRNGADVLLKSLFTTLGGRTGLMLFSLALFGTGAVLVWRDRRRAAEPLDARVFGYMLGESVLYAGGFGFVVGWLTSLVLAGPRLLALQGTALDLPTQLVVSLGAGIYEELLFRVLLTGGLLWGFRAAFKWGRPAAASGAVLLSALIFSAFHYIGPLGDAFTVSSFTFRAIAGVAFSGLYVTRGLGITAWTHALYDVGLSVLMA